MSSFSQRILAWYNDNARQLPWRVPPGGPPQDPYIVWLSEIMLQQTTVTAVIPYFHRFLQRFPTVKHLAQAPEDEVLLLWQGLGYYRRARHLHAAAKLLVENHTGQNQGLFPTTQQAWQALPGIGPYTAAAITAMALHEPAVALDVHIMRIMERHGAFHDLPGPAKKKALEQAAKEFLPTSHWGDYTQALMDLGTTVCTPGKKPPLCNLCPVADTCQSFNQGMIPMTVKAPSKPQRHGHVFLLTRLDQDQPHILLWHNKSHNLLGGLWGFPTFPFPWTTQELENPCLAQENLHHVATVSHTFTHFHLLLKIWRGPWTPEVQHTFAQDAYTWHPTNALNALAFSTLMRKVQKHML